MSKFAELLESASIAVPIRGPDVGSGSGSSARSEISSEPRTPENRDLYGRVCDVSAAAVEGKARRLEPAQNGEGGDGAALAELAREFGVEAQLVQALAQRLAGLC